MSQAVRATTFRNTRSSLRLEVEHARKSPNGRHTMIGSISGRLRLLTALVLLLCVPALAAARGSIEITRDLNQDPAPPHKRGAGAARPTAIGGLIFFAGRDVDSGVELWTSEHPRRHASRRVDSGVRDLAHGASRDRRDRVLRGPGAGGRGGAFAHGRDVHWAPSHFRPADLRVRWHRPRRVLHDEPLLPPEHRPGALGDRRNRRRYRAHGASGGGLPLDAAGKPRRRQWAAVLDR